MGCTDLGYICKYLLRAIMMYKKYWIPGVIFALVMFVVSNALNLSISYMGNTSSDVSMEVVSMFWPLILMQIFKVFAAYLVISVSLNIVYASAFLFVEERFKKRIHNGFVYLLTFFSFYFFFMGKLIYNPQLFIDNFAAKSSFLTSYQIFFTDNFSPAVFYTLFYLMNLPLFFFFLSNVYGRIKKSNIAIKIVHSIELFSVKKKIIITGSLMLLLVLGIILNLSFSKNSEIEKKNIIIISADSVRPDRISGNGYFRETTPNIDSMLADGLQFKKVITAVPRTFPAWMSALTSSYPLQHDIGHMFPRSRERSLEFNSAVKYLAQKGYYTSVLSEFAGDIFSRVDLGFETVKAPDMNFNVIVKQVILEKQVFLLPFVLNRAGRFIFPEIRDFAKFSDPEMLTRETISEIDKSGEKPFFITVFYSTTHFPFSATYPYYNMFADKKYEGPYKYFKQIVVQIGDDGEDGDAPDNSIVSEADKAQVNALYDACLFQFDKEIGRIIAHLKKRNMLDNTLVIVTSDHGENLYEYDYGIGHGEHLRGDFALSVPLIFYSGMLDAKFKGNIIDKTGSMIDIMPTAFDLLQIDSPSFFRGQSLFNKVEGGIDAYAETGIWFDNNKSSSLFFYHNRIDYPDISGILEVDFGYNREGVVKQYYQNIIRGSKYRAIYSGDYKLIYIPMAKSVKYELYNYKKDGDNRFNLAESHPQILEHMKNKFFEFAKEESAGNYYKVGQYLLPFYTDPIF